MTSFAGSLRDWRRWPLVRVRDGLVVVIWVLLFALFSTHASNWLYKHGVLPWRPILILVLLLAPLLLYRLRTLLQPAGARVLLIDAEALPVLRHSLPLWVVFGALAALSLLQSTRPGAVWSYGLGDILRLPFDLMVLLVAALLASDPLLRRFTPPVLRMSWWLLLLALAVDVLAPGTLSKQLARAAGFAEVANTGAYLLVFYAAVLIDYDRVRGVDVARLVATGLGVLVTLSRSGLLVFLMLLLSYAIAVTVPRTRRSLPRLQAKRFLGGVLVLAGMLTVLLLSVLAVRHAPGMFERHQAQQRLGMFLGQDVTDKLSHRQQLLQESLEMIQQRPVLGHGTGASRRLSDRAHNIYVDLWVNFGIAGPLLYLALLVIGWRIFQRQGAWGGGTMVVLIGVISLVDHTILDDRSVLLLWGVTLAWVLGAERLKRRAGEVATPGAPVRDRVPSDTRAATPAG